MMSDLMARIIPNKPVGLAAFLALFVVPFIAMLAMLMPSVAMSSSESILAQAYSQARKDSARTRYKPSQPAELEATEDLFVRLLQGQDPVTLDTLAGKAGWVLRSEKRAENSVVVVAELPTARRGRGLYAFFEHGHHALQAPHVPSDKLTGEILLRYGEESLPRALAWNTVHRSVADLAHLDGTDFIAFSRAFARVHPDQKIIQFHGFDADRRKTNAASESAAIVSAGHSQPDRELRDAVRCMNSKVDSSTRLYGVDVQELGGTTNNIYHALRAMGYEHFIHLEINLPLREQLLMDVKKRKALFGCLGGQR